MKSLKNDGMIASAAEKEIALAYIHAPALDPFGLHPERSKHIWDVAKAIDTLYTRKTVTKGRNLNAQGMYYCVDCDSFIRCSQLQHEVYIRCMGDGCNHCGECA